MGLYHPGFLWFNIIKGVYNMYRELIDDLILVAVGAGLGTLIVVGSTILLDYL